MRENKFQANLIKKIKRMFPGCVVLKNDPNYKQGIPDILILWRDKWAILENKKDINAPHQPNQDFFIKTMNGMSFARFIYPENEKEVLDDLQRTFRAPR